jgi:hypothetical protein
VRHYKHYVVSIGYVVLALFVSLAAVTPVRADENKLIVVDANHVAIRGYDTVAYFTDGKAIKGSSEFVYVWGDARWQFSTAAHRNMFAADPDRYAPQYGGYCAGAMVSGVLTPADPQAWAIVDGKLYMIRNKALVDDWKAYESENIKQADESWKWRRAH